VHKPTITFLMLLLVSSPALAARHPSAAAPILPDIAALPPYPLSPGSAGRDEFGHQALPRGDQANARPRRPVRYHYSHKGRQSSPDGGVIGQKGGQHSPGETQGTSQASPGKPGAQGPAISSARGPGTLIDAKTGAVAYVSARALPRFACLLAKLDAAGYPVREIGGFGERPNNASAHPTGNALDVNQCGRNCVSPRLPKGFADMAEACGLVSGSSWRGSPDTGHFEMPGKIGYVFPGRRYTHYASHRRVHYASK
jgi:hypothetical protein